jgi:hypothetical protein
VKKEGCGGRRERDAILKHVRYLSGLTTYLSGRQLADQHSAEPCASGRVT